MTEKFSEIRLEQNGLASRCTESTHWRIAHRLEDEYLIESLLGKGSSAFVVSARPLCAKVAKRNATVALKIYSTPLLRQEPVNDALPCEISVLMAISQTIGRQQNIVEMLDFFEWQPRKDEEDISSPLLKRLSFRAGCSYKVVVLEHIVGTSVELSIEKKLTPFVPTPASVVRGVLTSTLRALSALHALGMAHRDIKPANIIRRKTSLSAVLVDYGFAACRALETDESEPLSMCRRPFAGSPLFISPEFAEKCETRNATASASTSFAFRDTLVTPTPLSLVPSIDEAMASDVWATALSVMCMRNGSFPHPHCTSRGELFRSFHTYQGPPKVLIAEDALLNSVLRKMLKKDWRKRITACSALRELSVREGKSREDNENVEPDYEWHSAIPRCSFFPDFGHDIDVVADVDTNFVLTTDGVASSESVLSLKRRKT